MFPPGPPSALSLDSLTPSDKLKYHNQPALKGQPVFNANLYPVHAFIVKLHTGVGRTPDGWETSNLHRVGRVVIVGKLTARRLLAGIRGIGMRTAGLEGVESSIRGTPYIGGHIDLYAAMGRPVYYLERVQVEGLNVSRPTRYSGEVTGSPSTVRTVSATLNGTHCQYDGAGDSILDSIQEAIEAMMVEQGY